MSFKTPRAELCQHFQTIFSVLHLLLEDLKLNKLRSKNETQRMAKMLVKMALAMDAHRKAAYI